MNLPHIYHKNVHVLEGELKIVTHNELIECVLFTILNWASEASPTLGCSIEISRDI